jgi:hypothetical protein
MSVGWSGSDPTAFDEGGPQEYELGTQYVAVGNIIMSHVRIWSGGTTLDISGRSARVWNSNGNQIAIVDIPDQMPLDGWNEYALDDPINFSAGTTFYVSYSTNRYYATTAGGYPRDSADDLVRATGGRFITSMANFPSSPSNTFYGADFVYTENTETDDPPVIGGMTITKNEATATATITVEDESPGSVVVEWHWGDGTSTTTAAGVLTAQHTYTATGVYAIMAVASDTEGQTDSFADAVSIYISGLTAANEAWIDDIFDAVVSDVQRSGYFDKVNTHEPKRGPRTGLTAAIWLQALDPLALNSGLASTSARVVFTLRMYQSMLKEPQDMIDPMMTKAASNLMRRYHDDFDFEGAIRNIDLLGAFGIPLSAVAGYLEVDGKMYRIIDMTIPCLVNDVWPQVS